ncbi:hypothetical protein CFIO01_05785 [Colletotrichum fioriniae PJ7]|uniref:Uncharacterized protein n=1 Tax=Colletotrichum fioriniae PJ7 TaxID=1445577 RepID=A0A010QQT5_9PEZI|nr:hypothetical protein CFIO01_05785 [Colletotrichum fioriniae PJ7]
MIRPPTAQLSQSTVPRSLFTSLVSYLGLGESDAPSPYRLGLIDPGDSSPVNATQETFFCFFAPFCIRIREISTYPDRPGLLWRLPGQMSLTADSKIGQEQHPGKKSGPCPARRSAFSLRYAGDLAMP